MFLLILLLYRRWLSKEIIPSWCGRILLTVSGVSVCKNLQWNLPHPAERSCQPTEKLSSGRVPLAFPASHGLITIAEGSSVLSRLACREKQGTVLNLSFCLLLKIHVYVLVSPKKYEQSSLNLHISLTESKASGWRGFKLTALWICCQHPRPQESPQRDYIVYLPLLHSNLCAVHTVRPGCFNY